MSIESMTTGFIVATIVAGVVGTVATVVVVIVVIRYLNKATQGARPFAHFEIGTSRRPMSNSTPQESSVVPDPQIEATMKRFFSNIAKEKPIMFSAQQLSGFSQHYKTRLGSGGFGVVYKGEFPNGVPVAIKLLNKASYKQAKEQFMAEVSTIGITNHVNFVRLYGFCFDSSVQALVYEYMEKGSLDSLLFDRNQRIEWEKLHVIARGTAKGIAYLHEECQKRIIHYDIKPGNVLLGPALFPKVADFGLAKLSNRDSTHITMTDCRGTPGYAAPEMYMPYPVTSKCDVYSFGMLLFEILGRRKNLNSNLSEPEYWLPRWTWEMFGKGKLSELLEKFGIEEEHREKAERMAMVALWCVQYLPDSRPLMSNVVRMLEEGSEIKSPPNPFQHLVSATPNFTLSISESDSSLSKERQSSTSDF
ncbi:rust resistance kinase Lr10-like [Macadamia integrifolia]|uniref:rust resistance kinase Lr10-like n=1 Tax=Macadamia integrifolia TaxID=60698 RepID=UPI001C4F42D2|nr:rust resistance kinase Lr10-like [Macadamia integrifolia]